MNSEEASYEEARFEEASYEEASCKKGKTYKVVRNFIGYISGEEFIARVAKAYLEKEINT